VQGVDVSLGQKLLRDFISALLGGFSRYADPPFSLYY